MTPPVTNKLYLPKQILETACSLSVLLLENTDESFPVSVTYKKTVANRELFLHLFSRGAHLQNTKLEEKVKPKRSH